MNATRTTYRISGTLTGSLWWPAGEPACKTFEYREERRADEDRPAMVELAESVMRREDGDFSSAALLMGDAVLTVTRHGATGHHSRSWYACDLPSLRDYTTADLPAYVFED